MIRIILWLRIRTHAYLEAKLVHSSIIERYLERDVHLARGKGELDLADLLAVVGKLKDCGKRGVDLYVRFYVHIDHKGLVDHKVLIGNIDRYDLHLVLFLGGEVHGVNSYALCRYGLDHRESLAVGLNSVGEQNDLRTPGVGEDILCVLER